MREKVALIAKIRAIESVPRMRCKVIQSKSPLMIETKNNI